MLASAKAPTSFEFSVAGARPELNADGGVDLIVGGVKVGVVPPLTVDTAERSVTPKAAGAVFEVSAKDDSGSITVSVSREWLESLPASAFPVVIDPTVFDAESGTQAVSYTSGGSQVSGLRVGTNQATGSTWRARAYVPTPTLPSGGQPWHLVWAQLRVDTSVIGFEEFQVFGHNLQPMSFGAIVNSGTALPSYSWLGGHSADVTSWAASHPGGSWYGMRGLEPPTASWPEDMDSYEVLTDLAIEYRYYQTPNPTVLTSPTGTVSSSTPTLEAAATNDPNALYEFRVSTESGGGGTVLDSGWLNSRTWTVPAGALADGMTYFVRVRTGIGSPWSPTNYAPPAAATEFRSFTVKKRMGAGGPSATDTVGTVPGSTVTPSEGAPSPSTPTANVTVNMMTGNLAVSVSPHQLETLSGSAGVALNYDSQGATSVDGGQTGLYGTYSSGGSVIGKRVDPAVNFVWASSPMGGYTASWSGVSASWSGVITVPSTGTWRLGGRTGSGTMTVYLDGSSTPYVTVGAGSSPSFGAALGWAPGSAHSVRVEYSTAGSGDVQFWARNDSAPTGESDRFVVPGSWLRPGVTGLPAGWRLAANPGAGSWNRAQDLGSHVVVHSSSGDTLVFTRRNDGTYAPPAGSTDYLTVATTTVAGAATKGDIELSTSDNVLYRFGNDGWVRSVSTVADDRQPTALSYTYTTLAGTVGSPVLTAITDPVTGRSINLCYGASSCDGSGYGQASNAPDGMLARIDYWDGTPGAPSFSKLVYDGSGLLVRLVNPGGVTADFAYSGTGLLSLVRDPLAFDAVSSGNRSDCPASATDGTPTCATTISYLPNGRVSSVTQPAPTPGATRSRRVYSYDLAKKEAWVNVDGFVASSTYATRLTWDDQGRVTKSEDAGGRATETTWDTTVDRVLKSKDAAGLQTTDVYDTFTNLLTDRYGPAPASCFSTNAPYTPAGACSVTVPRTQYRYDEGIDGLAATFWSNPYFAGTPARHGVGPGGTGPSGPGCPADTLCTQWATNALPVTPSGVTRPSSQTSSPFTWSMRLTGIVDLSIPALLQASTTQRVMLYVDGVLWYDMNAPSANEDDVSDYGEWQSGMWPASPIIPAGRHRIQIDFLGSSNTLNGLYITGTGCCAMPNSMQDPDFGRVTTTIDPDGKVVSTSYVDAASGIGAELGLVTAVTQDPASLALRSTTSYESPSSNRWLRKTASSLPGGSTTTYVHYCGTPTHSSCGSGQVSGALATACGVTAGSPQWGRVAQQTDPAPSSTVAGRAQQFLYDPAGRMVGRRVGPGASISSQPWECTSYDARGRVITRTWPAQGSSAARVATYTYGVWGNPLISAVTDNNATPADPTDDPVVSSTVDLLGRLVSYSDAVGHSTYYTYDQPGRLVRTVSGAMIVNQGYDNKSQLTSVTATVGGSTKADASVTYDSVGRMTAVTYQGGALSQSVGYDQRGNRVGVTYERPSGGEPTPVGVHTATKSSGGRVVESKVAVSVGGLTDPNPSGDDLVYDGAGRLVTAHLGVGRGDYHYGSATGGNCSSQAGNNAAAGANTNRVRSTWTPAGQGASVTHSCFNGADQLVSSTTGSVTTSVSYDAHGNTTAEGATSYTWDSSDRLASMSTGSTSVSYLRDPLDRLTGRVEGSSTTRYGYSGFGDAIAAVYDENYQRVEDVVVLPGGVSVTVPTGGDDPSLALPDLFGHTLVVTNQVGEAQGGLVRYDPWGAPLTAVADTVAGSAELAAYGSSSKLSESNGVVHMGARALSTRSGRFLSVDPIQGGCANAYVYVYGDPINTSDLSGKGFWSNVLSVAAVVIPLAVCTFSTAGACAVAAAAGFAVRTGQRAAKCGNQAIFSAETGFDAVLTAGTVGTGALVSAAKAGRGLSGAGRGLASALVAGDRAATRDAAGRLVESGVITGLASGGGALPAGSALARKNASDC